MKSRSLRLAALLCMLVATAAPRALAQTFDSKFSSNLRWRSIGPLRGGRGAPAGGPDTLNSVRASLSNLQRLLQAADSAPTTQESAAVADRHKAFTALQQRWISLQNELKQLNLP